MDTQYKPLIEALLFIATEPLPPGELERVIGISAETVKETIDMLAREYDETGRGFQVKRMGQGYSIVTRPEYAEYIREFFQPKVQQRLTQAALETLAIIAYKQPITRAEIEEIRGVKVEKALITLQKRNLIKEMGRKHTIGTPIIYGTTDEFFQYFGLKDLTELPKPSDLILYEQKQAAGQIDDDDLDWEENWDEESLAEAEKALQALEEAEATQVQVSQPLPAVSEAASSGQSAAAEGIGAEHLVSEDGQASNGTTQYADVKRTAAEVTAKLQDSEEAPTARSTKSAKGTRRKKGGKDDGKDMEVAEQVPLLLGK